MDSTGEDAPLTPDEAFGLLGNETRMATLRALWEQTDPEQYALSEASPVPFGELRELVGVEDSGNFNYHLGKLTGALVAEREDGYVLSGQGVELLRAIETGLNLEDERIEPTPLSDPCPFCGGTLRGSYEDQYLLVECADCPGLEADGIIYKGRAPPASVADRTIEEVIEAELSRYVAFDTLAEEGVCPACSATVDGDLRACEDHRTDDGLCPSCDRRFGTHRGIECTVCGAKAWSPALTYLIDVPAVRSFFADHGIDTDRQLSWEFFRSLNGHAEETIRSVDPVDVAYEFEIDGDTLRTTIEAVPDSEPAVSVDRA